MTICVYLILSAVSERSQWNEFNSFTKRNFKSLNCCNFKNGILKLPREWLINNGFGKAHITKYIPM